MNETETVTVTWMDGTQKTFTCYDSRVHEGVLFLIQRPYSAEPKRAIPLHNVRDWTTT